MFSNRRVFADVDKLAEESERKEETPSPTEDPGPKEKTEGTDMKRGQC